MNVFHMIPMIIIGIVLQLIVQIRCIKNCINNTRLTSRKRIIWIIIIAFFNILGIIVYLIVTRKKSLDYSEMDMDENVDNNVRHVIFLSLVYAYQILAFSIIMQNPENMLIVILLSLSFILFILHHYFDREKLKRLYYALPFIQVLLMIVLDYIAESSDLKIIILVVVANIVNEYPLRFFKVFFWIPLILYEGTATIKLLNTSTNITSDDLVIYLIKNSITYVLVVFTFYIARKQLILNNHLQVLMRELKDKTQKLEEVSVIEERNRIAREIHDTLGHTLTGAIIQLEAAKKLVYVDQKKAVQSIEQTQNITRSGFSDVKRAIKALRPIMIENNTLKDALALLFERTQNDFEYTIDSDIQIPDNISDDVKECVYRILQELITNSIRHGNANALQVSIEHQYNVLRINTKDNGKGSKVINEGYGLSGIRERVELLDGQVYFSSKENNGFSSVIYIPLKENN